MNKTLELKIIKLIEIMHGKKLSIASCYSIGYMVEQFMNKKNMTMYAPSKLVAMLFKKAGFMVTQEFNSDYFIVVA